jgi:hypothetical protein
MIKRRPRKVGARNMVFVAQYHHHGYGGGTVDWLTHMVVSSVVHGLIYSAIFRLMHGLTLMQVLVLVGIVLAVIFMWGGPVTGGDGD